MALIKGKESSAIENDKNWGPIFGGEKDRHDLAIADKGS
jgi:hypothetical protein